MDLQVVFQEQVVGFVDAARQTVLHRHSAEGGRAVLHRIKDILEGVAGQGIHRLPKMGADRLFGISAVFALKCDGCHREGSLRSA